MRFLDDLICELANIDPGAWECHDETVWRMRLDSGGTITVSNVSQHDKLGLLLGDTQIPLARDQQMRLFRLCLGHRAAQQETMVATALAQIRLLKMRVSPAADPESGSPNGDEQ
jgi:hypothetical protein